MKIKTLKDFYSKDEPEFGVLLNEQKEEGIKLAKEIIKAEDLGATIRESWKFIHFFNITEDDLK